MKSWFLTWLVVGVIAGACACGSAAELPVLKLRSDAQVDASGVLLSQLLMGDAAGLKIRICNAPAWGQKLTLSRAQISEMSAKAGIVATNWSGANQVHVTRQSKLLSEAELRQMLTGELQRGYVRDRGELELRISRPWTPLPVPSEPLTLRILDLPSVGVSPNFILRFELSAGEEVLGNWQVVLQARIWKEIWVAGSPLKRGELLATADVIKERRDVLGMRDLIPPSAMADPTLELIESVPAGAPISTRCVGARPVLLRGSTAQAVVKDQNLTISLKVEVLQNGASGQLVRVRNPESKREFVAKVYDAQTVLLMP